MSMSDDDPQHVLSSAWVIIAHHRAEPSKWAFRFLGLLDHQITGQAMLRIMESLCRAYLEEQDPGRNIAGEWHIDFTYLNDGSPYQDQVMGTWLTQYALEASRGYDVTFLHDAMGLAYIKWRVKHPLVNEAGEIETMFEEELGLRVTGFSEFVDFE